MQTVSEYCLERFGEKLYKLSLNGGMTCPNRDGTLGRDGCIFCSAGGSGEFAPDPSLPVEEQLAGARARVAGKFHGDRYITYFQSFTNTYAPVERLSALFWPVIRRPEIAVLSIATRPDCLGPQVMALLAELAACKPVWVELGLQTASDETARFIRRGYETQVYDEAVRQLTAAGIHVITHVILGLPGENRAQMLETVRHVTQTAGRFLQKGQKAGIKLQLLHVLSGTDLAKMYAEKPFPLLSQEEYVSLVGEICAELPDYMVVHRMTGDGPRKLLIEPRWSLDKKRVLSALHQELERRGLQG